MDEQTWTPKKIKDLKRLVIEGFSANEIAGEIGATRNAVIGKIHRLGLITRKSRVTKKAAKVKKPKPVRMTKFSPPPPPRQAVTVTPDPAPKAENTAPVYVDTPVEQRKSIFELTVETCHWPVGTPGTDEFYYCGRKTVEQLPYCPGHCRMAYLPATDRRRDNRATRKYYR
jgi:GcrA cell cycle regulator